MRLYDRLFNHEAPDKGDNDFMDHINPDSLTVVEEAWIEPSLAEALPEQGFQFEREGYFVADRYDHSPESRFSTGRLACAIPGRRVRKDHEPDTLQHHECPEGSL